MSLEAGSERASCCPNGALKDKQELISLGSGSRVPSMGRDQGAKREAQITGGPECPLRGMGSVYSESCGEPGRKQSPSSALGTPSKGEIKEVLFPQGIEAMGRAGQLAW